MPGKEEDNLLRHTLEALLFTFYDMWADLAQLLPRSTAVPLYWISIEKQVRSIPMPLSGVTSLRLGFVSPSLSSAVTCW